jgi:hypothetical protein
MAEQVPVFRWVAVDAASGPVDDPFIPEVDGQSAVIRGKGARATHDGQGQNVGIVGYACSSGAEPLFLMLEPLRIGRSQAPRPIKLHESSSHILVTG